MDVSSFIEKDRFGKYLGIEIADYSPGYAVAKMEIKTDHLNSLGTVHGGAIFTLADAACAVAAHSHGKLCMAINLTISYFNAQTSGVLYAKATEMSINSKLATYLIEVSDENNLLIALVQGTVYRKA